MSRRDGGVSEGEDGGQLRQVILMSGDIGLIICAQHFLYDMSAHEASSKLNNGL